MARAGGQAKRVRHSGLAGPKCLSITSGSEADALTISIPARTAASETKYPSKVNCPQRITLGELAKVAHLSPNHLLRLFKTATGSTPGEYLLRVRLRHAAKLLRQSGLPIGEVAESSGFPDSNYFSRKFRALYGKNPRAYRGTAASSD